MKQGLSYLIPPATVTVLHLLTRQQTPMVRVFVICFGLMYSMKALVISEEVRNGLKMRTSAWAVYAIVWVGMRPRRLASVFRLQSNGWQDVLRGLFFVAAGSLALALIDLNGPEIIQVIIAFVSLIWLLHFGLLNILCGMLRMAGAKVRRPMYVPMLAGSLTDFWGKRWNRPFTDMLQVTLYRRFRGRLSRVWLVLLSFLVSGILHEVAIGLPVQASYGQPTGYFIIQGLGVIAETRTKLTGLLGRIWTMAVLVIPLPLLFPEPFLMQVVVPTARVLQSLITN